MSKVGKYTYYLSTRKDKKLMVNPDGKKWLHFGQKGYDHFFDKTGLLPTSMNHNDKTRRESYLTRAQGIRDKQKQLTANNPLSSNYHAIKILW